MKHEPLDGWRMRLDLDVWKNIYLTHVLSSPFAQILIYYYESSLLLESSVDSQKVDLSIPF